MELWSQIVAFFTVERLLSLLQAAFLLALGMVLAKLAAAAVTRMSHGRASAQQKMLLRRVVYYVILLLFAFSALHAVGFDLSILLGAAGVLTVAVGFASQTSASNLISGLFLLGERPFVVGDVITVGSTTGEVVSIDLLSVKLRTFDNLMVRIPNETLLKTEITTLTRFPIRRLDLRFRVPLDADLGRVHDVVAAAAEAEPLAFDEPKPIFMILGFGESGIDLQLSLWAQRQSFLAVRTAMYRAVQERLLAAGIPIPAPVRQLQGQGAGEAAGGSETPGADILPAP